MDEHGERQRKGFTGKTKQIVNDKITDYITNFNKEIADSQEATKTLRESMQRWLEVFKFPSVERTTYDRSECTARTQIYPVLGDKVVGNITAADIKALLNRRMNEGYAYTTVKKVHVVLNEYFRYLTQQEFIDKNPMTLVPMIKRANFLAAQDKEDLPESEKISVFTPEEIEKFKAEAFRCWGTERRIYRQPAAYILLLNTGLRTGELLGLLNSDIDLENRMMRIQRNVKEILKRDGTTATSGMEMKVGKLKSASSKREVPLNETAIAMIKDLRQEAYFGEDTPLVCNENGDYTMPEYFRKHYYRILKAAGIEKRGLHSFRHTFATSLVNGIKTTGRYNYRPLPETGCGSARAQHITDHRTVLRKERYRPTQRDHGQFQSVRCWWAKGTVKSTLTRPHYIPFERSW